jgi:hypothetical protein
LKLAFEIDALLIVMLLAELFVTVSDSVLLAPVTTVPKFKVVLPRVRFCVWDVPVELAAPHPDQAAMPATNSAKTIPLLAQKPCNPDTSSSYLTQKMKDTKA